MGATWRSYEPGRRAVQRVYGRAPGDVVGAGAPIADLLGSQS